MRDLGFLVLISLAGACDLSTTKNKSSYPSQPYRGSYTTHSNVVMPEAPALARVPQARASLDCPATTASSKTGAATGYRYSRIFNSISDWQSNGVRAGFRSDRATLPGKAPSTQSNSEITGIDSLSASINAYNSSSPDIQRIKTPGGASFLVHRKFAGNFMGFLSELEAKGYGLHDTRRENLPAARPDGYFQKGSAGYQPRAIAGTNYLSNHALGAAVDINMEYNCIDRANPTQFRSNLPSDIETLAKRWGLSWGGRWRSLSDSQHFEFNSKNGVAPLSIADYQKIRQFGL